MASRYEAEITITSAKDLKNVNWHHGKLKPYAVVWIDPKSKCSARVDEEGDTSPFWNDKLTIPFNSPIEDSTLYIDIVHANAADDTKPLIGSAKIPLNDVGLGTVGERKIELIRPSGRPQGKIDVKISVREPRYHAPEMQMKMKVTLSSSCLIRPSEPTWTGCMALTELDQTGALAHTTTIYFYRPCSNWLEDDAIIKTLKTSLSKVLIHFYPLAGRLRLLDGARLELDCNAHGALVIEASCDAKLNDYVPSHDLYHYLYPQINYLATPIEEIPVFIVQLTKFQCGGITISYTMAHVIGDGKSGQHFLSEWARVARGEPLRTPPFLDRKVLRAGELGPRKPPRFHHVESDPMPLLIGQSSSEGERKKETRIAWLKMSKAQVETLRNEANYNKGQTTGARYTRYEAIAGHIWRCMCRARGNRPDQPTTLWICVDIRKRMDPPLPPNYYGNGIIDVISKSCSGDVIKKPLSYATGRIREAIDRVTSEYVHSAIDYLKNMKDLSRYQDIEYTTTNQQGPFNGNPNLTVTSWTSVDGLYDMDFGDFGWGNEFLMSPAPQDYNDGDAVITRGYGDGDGDLVIFICLQAAFMPGFTTFFYQNIQKSNL